MAKPGSLDPLRRFTDRVDDYVKYRPSYPLAVVQLLSSRAGLFPSSVVADIGSGTGIFTTLLLETGAQVVGVEPNDGMRRAAEAALGGHPHFRSLKGTAEATGLDSGSVALVTCAQAFHWFDLVPTRREFQRILAPGGWCSLVWNTAITDKSPFAVGYERVKEEYRTDLSRARHDNLDKEGLCDAFFGPGNWKKQVFENFQTLDLPGLKGRLLSSSYAPKEGDPRHEPMMDALTRLFHETQKAGRVRMDYATQLLLGRLAA